MKKRRKHLNPKPFLVVAIILIIVIGGYFILGKGQNNKNYFDFTACLADKGATEYGFDACPNCQKQKSILGADAFSQNIDKAGFYIRCRPEDEANKPIGNRLDRITILDQYADQITDATTQGELCLLMVAQGTPTWLIGEHRVSGWQTIPELAELSGCPIPEDYNN